MRHPRSQAGGTLSCLCLIPLVFLLASAAHATPEPAGSADDFVERIGVCTHWGYPDTPYGYAYEQVKKLLGECGIRHVRDGFHARELDLYATYGIRATVILGPGGPSPEQKVRELAPNASLLDMVEGPNEVDIFPSSANYRGKGFPEGPIAFQNDLYAAVKGNPDTAKLSVIAPSTARRGSNLRLAPLKGLDYLVMHSYAGGGPPAGSLEGDFSNSLEATRILGPGAVLKPIVVTESGYHTAVDANLTLGGVQPGVTERTQAKYVLRHFAEYFNAGIVRTFVYEFINEFKDEKTNAEASFGMVRRDLTPKPAYQALKNLIALLAEARWDAAAKQWQVPPVQRRALDFELSGETKNVHHTLLQKSTGEFYLLLWQEVPSYDTQNKREIEVPDAAVTLTLKSPVREAICYLPVRGTDAVRTFRATSKIPLAVPDEVLVLKLTPASPARRAAPAAPQRVDAESTGNSVSLSWPAVRGAKGYFVSRQGRYLGSVSKPAFSESRLLPNTGYPYSVQSCDASGNVSAPVAVVARTQATYPDLVVSDLTWTPQNPKPGEAVVFSATIKNLGNGAAPEGITHGIAFFVDGVFAAWSDTLNQPLAPGASKTLEVNNGPKGTRAWTATAGEHTVLAHVDDVDRINESNEKNNTLEKKLVVGE